MIEMKCMYNNFFLDYKSESKVKLHEYMNFLEAEIDKKIDINSPYINGDFEKNVEKFLEEKFLRELGKSSNEVLIEMADYFSGTTRWHHPYVMNNIKTPVNLLSLAVVYNAMMYDPNLAGDTNCGKIAFAELEVIKYISDLVGWDWRKSGGYFTFGGTSTLLNAVKIGINKAIDGVCKEGIKEDVFIVSSEQGHSAHGDVCNWLGIGKNSCLRMPVNESFQIDITKTEEIISQKIEEGKKWVGIIACGGTTIQTIVDSIYDIYTMREKLVERYQLPYKPHIHVDSVVGWVWLFYKFYSFSENKLGLSDMVLNKIEKMCRLISDVKYADSIGIDFHKTGFCPYASSLILTRDRREIYKLNENSPVPLSDVQYGGYSPSNYTLELSRSSTGPLAALTSLQLFGIEGYQKLLGDIIEGACALIEYLSKEDCFEVINKNTNGTCILFIIKQQSSNLLYNGFSEATEQEITNIALYNYRFYLYVLTNIKNKKVNFFIDYSSGFEKIKQGFHMGILKMQTFNPMLTKTRARLLVNNILKLKREYDLVWKNFKEDPVYLPKRFKLKYKNNGYELQGGKVCLKK